MKHLQIVSCTKWQATFSSRRRDQLSYACPAHKRSSHAAGGNSSSGKHCMTSHRNARPCFTLLHDRDPLAQDIHASREHCVHEARFLLSPGYVLRKAQASAELPNITYTGREQRPGNDNQCALRAHTSSCSHPPTSSHQLGEHYVFL